MLREDAQPEGTKPGARWRGARHSWEVLRQQGPNVQGTNLVPTEMPVVAQGQELFEVLPRGTRCAPRQGRTAPLGPPSQPVCTAGAPARGGGRQPPFTQISARGKKNKALYFGVIKTKRGAAAKPQPERSGVRVPSQRQWNLRLEGARAD